MYALSVFQTWQHKQRMGRHGLALLCGLMISLMAVLPALAAAPDAGPITTSTTEDTPVVIDTGEPLTNGNTIAFGTTPPAHGTINVGNNGTNLTIIYTPGANQTAPVTFKYQFCTTGSPQQCGTQGTVSISINAVDDPPVANPDTATVNEDTLSNTINVLSNDNAGPNEGTAGLALVRVASQPTNGTATKSGNSVIYVPNANFCNWDGTAWVGPQELFSYDMTDSPGAPTPVEVTAQVTVKVTCVNDAPVAVDDGTALAPFATVNEGSGYTPFDVRANDTDLEDATTALTISDIPVGPTNGDARINSTVVEYMPNTNYCGPDSFTYEIQDTAGATDTATVYVDVTCITNPAIVTIEGPNSVANHQFSIDLVLTSIDEDVSGVQFSLDYNELCIETVSMVVPYYMRDTGSQLDFLFTDTDGPPFDLLAGPGAASTKATLATVTFTVLPTCSGAADEVNVDFTFVNEQFFDENVEALAGSGENVSNMTITANQPPTAINLAPTPLIEGAAGADAGTLTTADADLPTDSHTYTLVAGTGSTDNTLFEISGNTLKLRDTVTADFESKASYAVRVRSTDSFNAFLEAPFTINVTDQNEPPIAVNDGSTTPILVIGNTVVDVLANDSDPNGSTITVHSVTNGLHGTVTDNNTSVIFSPNPTYSGLDSFTYTIIDTDAAPRTDTANVNVVVVANVAAGDCDASGSVNIGDVMSIAREIFDNSGQLWYMAFNNAFAGSPYGCDANRDQLINLLDITCAANIIFGHVCPPNEVWAANLAPAKLAVGGELAGEPGSTVRVPILLDTGGNDAVAASFAVNFAAIDASFNTADANNDGVYDAVSLNVASDIFKYVYFDQEASRIEFVLADISDPYLTLTDGEIAAIELTISDNTNAGDIMLTLTHSELSTSSSQLIPLEVSDGAITINAPGGTNNEIQLFIPIIVN